MNPTAARCALGIYAAFLAVGGIMGYVKARSRPSLIAGLASAVGAASLLAWSLWQPFPAFVFAALLAALLGGMFGRRFGKTRKMMPSGMLLLVSLVMAVYLGAVAFVVDS